MSREEAKKAEEAARLKAEAEAAACGLTIVPPFDHPWIIAGAGTCGLEIVEQEPGVSAVYVPIGGGGLISGVASAIKNTQRDIRVVGVEPEGAPRMSASRATGRPVTLEGASTIADGLSPLRPGDVWMSCWLLLLLRTGRSR